MTHRCPTAPEEPCAPPALDELRVLALGLDPLTAAVCLALAEAGVCLLNIRDPAPVGTADVRHGPYPAEFQGQPRELVLRTLLRRRSPRCAPLSAPELFPSAAVPTAVVLHTWSVPGDLVADLATVPSPDLDPALPTLSVVRDGGSVVVWPLTDWAHRPCRACVASAVREARRAFRGSPPTPGEPLLPRQDGTVAVLTRTVATGEIAGRLLSHVLRDDAAPRAAPSDPPHDAPPDVPPAGTGTAPSGPPPARPPSGTQSPDGPDACLVLRRGLTVLPLAPDPRCLCSLAFTGL
ncbi:hypothetical protein MHK71_06865 [Kocuria indica]|uniref:hypothetical protein n=1 Tax=Kocuria marina TaxID=223184 RepID=UPI001EF5B8BB|nr:hypothetical protein [Kocuria indica]MCG7432233.1 hypothetical protein [Kocuria indica]